MSLHLSLISGNLNDFENCSEFFGGGLLLKAQLKRPQNSLEHVEAYLVFSILLLELLKRLSVKFNAFTCSVEEPKECIIRYIWCKYGILRCAKFQVDSCRGSGGMKPKKRRGKEEKEDQGVFPRSSTQNAKCNCSIHKHNISILFSYSESRQL
ncbi:hypothetical protein BJ165DRAFT_1409657 [Panaeolus papilionaceus]|nr:hypothetical protein BJ165DRAFT_1409657 [Panaeolus papilionaceus]